MKAIWRDCVIAESDDTIVVEGNHYFPPEACITKYFEPGDKQTICPWKGTAHYFDVVISGERNEAAAWFYPETKEAANNIKGRVAFWHGIEVID
jgi:uncharacterized protein (DUF427 family)